MAIGSYADDGDRAEVAFVVREDFQNMGVASRLLSLLEPIAKENAYQGFNATVLRENAAMIQVFKKRYPNAKISIGEDSDVSIVMDFSDAVAYEAFDRDNKECTC
jgi:GNAT superfamily N-acetyltransferase